MLFSFQFINHPLNKVGEIPFYFFEQSLIKNRFSYQLFPSWFRPVLKKLPALRKHFREVFLEIKNIKILQSKELKQLNDDLNAGYKIENLCNSKLLSPPKSKPISNDLHEKFKALYNYFFTETLKDSKKLFQACGGTFDEQYRTFRKTNLSLGKVCLTCGLHEYPLRSNEPKAQYDHWLPQDSYPLLAINFFNLVPICGICNNIKLAEDLLFDNHNRTVSFYPYEDHDSLMFKISSYTPFDKLGKIDQDKYTLGKYEWEIESTNAMDNDKVTSWNRVFRIKERYSSYIDEYYDDLKTTFKDYLKEQKLSFHNGDNKNNLMQVVNQFTSNRIKDIKRETGSHLKKSFLDFICLDGNESLLYTFFDLKCIAV